MHILAVLLAALVLLVVPGTALAGPGDPWVAYVANSVVTKQSAPSPVILRANPATGQLVEISRNGAQGEQFRHPYDIAVAADGSLLVADMGAYATPSDRTPDGRIIRVDPVTGQQSVVSSGSLLVDPAGLALAPDGLIYVVENVGTTGQPGVVSVNPATGAQTLVTQGAQLCYPFGIAVHPNGSLLVTNYGDFNDGTTVINCMHDFGALVQVDPVTKNQTILSRNAPQWGNLFRNPLGVTVEPGGRILLVNQNGGTALVAVDPDTGVQDAETTNTSTDRLELPQRPAVTPDGDVVVSDFTLDDLEGGLVAVDLPGGGQSILRQDRQLFNNPLGVAVVPNGAPVASLSASPATVAGGGQVTFDASGSSDPEGLQLRYAWDLDGNGSFETDGGTSPTITRTYSGTTTFTARVHVSDPHGASGVAGADVKVDSIPPVISSLRVRGATITYRLSEPARVKVQLQQLKRKRWRTVRVLRQDGVAGKNRLRASSRARAAKKRPPRVRYRAEAVAVDAVGNRSKPTRLRLSAKAAKRLRQRR
ncbi:MAG TPA: PKD domain-containing protein [Thermoleophilaceae bacterium]